MFSPCLYVPRQELVLPPKMTDLEDLALIRESNPRQFPIELSVGIQGTFPLFPVWDPYKAGSDTGLLHVFHRDIEQPPGKAIFEDGQQQTPFSRDGFLLTAEQQTLISVGTRLVGGEVNVFWVVSSLPLETDIEKMRLESWIMAEGPQ